MIRNFIAYFAERHILANLLFFCVLLGGWIAFQETPREEMPDFVHDQVSITVNYPGATASEVEHFVLRPLEEALRAVEGVGRVTSDASPGRGGVRAYLDPDVDDLTAKAAEIKSVVLEVPMPEEITDEPRIRQWKSANKAIIDIAVFDTSVHMLSSDQRRKLQAIARALEARLLQIPGIQAVTRDGFLTDQLRIEADPNRLRQYNLPLNSVAQTIRSQHQRRPVGTILDTQQSKVTVSAELTNKDRLSEVILQGGFVGPVVRLGDVATIQDGFAPPTELLKVNGHEAVILNAIKTTQIGIIAAVEEVKRVAREFEMEQLNPAGYSMAILDDEAIHVRNRMKLIGSNGLVGILLILVLLMIFLDWRSGIWVSIGIPFCFAFTFIGISWLGYTINNMTLAAIIIVMGMLVDDAIVVAENIVRCRQQGMSLFEASVEGARFVSMPITAAIATTCIAFVPLTFFQGRFGGFVQVIPPIISLMLVASLIECLLILPGHMRFGFWRSRKSSVPQVGSVSPSRHWFETVENFYEWTLGVTLRYKYLFFLLFALMLYWAFQHASQKMRFVMFPNEESTQVRIDVRTPPGTDKYQTADQLQRLEAIFKPYLGQEMVGFRAQIARNRWSGAANENQASLWVEVVSKEEREKALQTLIQEWRSVADTLSGFQRIHFRTQRFGSQGGSPIEIKILQQNDSLREMVADALIKGLNDHPVLEGAEKNEPQWFPEFQIGLRREALTRLSIAPENVATTLRTALQGSELYRLTGGLEEVPVQLTVPDSEKSDLRKILRLPVENRRGYLVPLRDIVWIDTARTPSSVRREESRRVTSVSADFVWQQKSNKTSAPRSPPTQEVPKTATPLEVAADLEQDLFPTLRQLSPSTLLLWDGEVADTRESGSFFQLAIAASTLLIFAALALLFNSLWIPLLIMVSIPFGLIGVVLAFYLHGKSEYGFFAIVGVLGLMGVVINDSIVMVVKLRHEFRSTDPDRLNLSIRQRVAAVSKTRFRAVLLTTLTTIAGLFPTAYGLLGFDAMLAEMMLAMGWGLAFGTFITLAMVPAAFCTAQEISHRLLPKVRSTS